MTLSRSHLFLGLYLAAACAFLFWSYALTDPNLVLTSFPPYWHLQQWLWKTLWQQPTILSGSYLLIICIWFASYAGFIRQLHSTQLPPSNIHKKVLFAVALMLVVSYNALSHDIFNYIFNAKMVLLYQLDPHIHTAIEFPQDLWTRFMHNTHTPAPYGYGWTALSLVPFFLTQSSFTLSWLTFKAFNLLGLYLVWFVLTKLNQKLHLHSSADFEKNLFIVFANPLVVIETLSTGHNDLWMMVPALFSILAIVIYWENRRLSNLIMAVGAYLFSLSTKWATLVIAPIWLLLACKPWVSIRLAKLKLLRHLSLWFTANWVTVASIALFIPLITDRSQQFHPWYLLWPLVWLPLMKKNLWFELLLVFSFSSMLRYLPWLVAGGYSPQVLSEQKLITWGIPTLWLIMKFTYAKIFPAK